MAVRNGGLGIRLTSHLATSAFIASAVGTRQLQDAILNQCECITSEDMLSVAQYLCGPEAMIPLNLLVLQLPIKPVGMLQ